MSIYHMFLKNEDTQHLKKWAGWLNSRDGRGDRARLRRARVPDDILLTEAYFNFLRRMPERWAAQENLQDSAMVCAVLAWVETSSDGISFAESLGTPPTSGSKKPMSELRFQQLQKSRSREDFFRRVCRAIKLLGRKADTCSVADSVGHWCKEHRYGVDKDPNKRLAVRWASDYYTASNKS